MFYGSNSMTGAPFSWEKKGGSQDVSAPRDTDSSDRYIDYSYAHAKYMGGHPLYVKPSDTGVYLYDDRIEVVNPKLIIPYSAILRIENMDEKKISASRVIVLGLVALPLAIVGAMWKKKHIYTVIQYVDEIGEKTIVLDFGKQVDKAQPLIYRKMSESRKNRL